METFNHNPKLYFIGGKARSGKTLVGNLIKDEYEKRKKKVAILSYAHYIKGYAKDFFGWDGNDETKPRGLLNELGTDIIRGKLKKEYMFIERMIEDIEVLSYFFDVIIVADVRFKSEIEIPNEFFGDKKTTSIKVERENFDSGLTEEQKNHITENDLNDYTKFDYIINNKGSIDDLMKETIDIINKADINK